MEQLQNYVCHLHELDSEAEVERICEEVLESYRRGGGYDTVRDILCGLQQAQYDTVVAPLLAEVAEYDMRTVEPDTCDNELQELLLHEEPLPQPVNPDEQPLVIEPPQTPGYTTQYLPGLTIYTKEPTETRPEAPDTELEASQLHYSQNPLLAAGLEQLTQVQAAFYMRLRANSHENYLVTAPTGSGKTGLAALYIAEYLESGDGVVLYTVPTRALCQEVYARLQNGYFPSIQSQALDNITETLNPEARIVVTTYERADVLLSNRGERLRLGLLVLDEVHNIGTRARGAAVESLATKVALLGGVRVLALSGSLESPVSLCRFLGAHHVAFDEGYRPISLEQRYYYFAAQNVYALKEQEFAVLLSLLRDELAGQECLVFVESRRGCCDLCARLLTALSAERRVVAVPSIFDPILRTAVAAGLAYHHAGLIPEDRNTVERLFRERHVTILIATETLAEGVNLPARNVIIYGTEVYDRDQRAFCHASCHDIMEMAGRAGREGFDDTGKAFIFCINQQQVHRYLVGNTSVRSELDSRLLKFVNDIIRLIEHKNGAPPTLEELTQTMQRTLYYYDTGEDTELTLSYIQGALELLLTLKIVEAAHGDSGIRQTPLGRIATQFYISPSTASLLSGFFECNRHFTRDDIYSILYYSTEFADKIIVESYERNIFQTRQEKFNHMLKVLLLEAVENDHRKYMNSLNAEIFEHELGYVKDQLKRLVPCLMQIVEASTDEPSAILAIVEVQQRFMVSELVEKKTTLETAISAELFLNELELYHLLFEFHGYDSQHTEMSFVDLKLFMQNEKEFIEQGVCPENLIYLQQKYEDTYDKLFGEYQQIMVQQIPAAEVQNIYVQPISRRLILVKLFISTENIQQIEGRNKLQLVVCRNNKVIEFVGDCNEHRYVFTLEYDVADAQLELYLSFQLIGFHNYKSFDLTQLRYLKEPVSRGLAGFSGTFDHQRETLFINPTTEEITQLHAAYKPLDTGRLEETGYFEQMLEEKGVLLLDLNSLVDHHQLNGRAELLIIMRERRNMKYYINFHRYGMEMGDCIAFLQLHPREVYGNVDSEAEMEFLESELDVRMADLLELMSGNSPISLERAIRMIENSYFYIRLLHNPSYYNFHDFTVENKYDLLQQNYRLAIDPEDANNFINSILEEVVEELGAERFE